MTGSGGHRTPERAANVPRTFVHSRERRTFVHPTPTPTKYGGCHLYLARPLRVTRASSGRAVPDD